MPFCASKGFTFHFHHPITTWSSLKILLIPTSIVATKKKKSKITPLNFLLYYFDNKNSMWMRLSYIFFCALTSLCRHTKSTHQTSDLFTQKKKILFTLKRETAKVVKSFDLVIANVITVITPDFISFSVSFLRPAKFCYLLLF